MDPASKLPEAKIAEMVSEVAAYFRREREVYFRASERLVPELRRAVQAYFAKSLLERVRTVVLKGARVPPPPFYSEAMALSSGNFPDFVHLASITYVDIIVFHDEIGIRTLFHGLVHAAQIANLGLERYADLYVRGFVRTRSWIAIPLEAQAYQLDTQFAKSGGKRFQWKAKLKRGMSKGSIRQRGIHPSRLNSNRGEKEESPRCLWGGTRGWWDGGAGLGEASAEQWVTSRIARRKGRAAATHRK